VNHICEVLEVSRAAYYQWSGGECCQRELTYRELSPIVRNLFLQHRRRYGARRLAVELRSMGYPCSREKTRKIMDKMNLIAIQPKSFRPRTTDSRHRLGYNDFLLVGGAKVTACNQVWVGDITYIGLEKRFAYMSVLMDLYSRKIIGWTIELDMSESLVIETLTKAISARQPGPQLIHHSDRGGQYASTKYRSILTRAKMRQSMSRAGDCYDNAFMESCFGTIKTELEMTSYGTLEDARCELEEYINYYNAIRRHSSIDYQSPTSFELALKN